MPPRPQEGVPSSAAKGAAEEVQEDAKPQMHSSAQEGAQGTLHTGRFWQSPFFEKKFFLWEKCILNLGPPREMPGVPGEGAAQGAASRVRIQARGAVREDPAQGAQAGGGEGQKVLLQEEVLAVVTERFDGFSNLMMQERS